MCGQENTSSELEAEGETVFFFFSKQSQRCALLTGGGGGDICECFCTHKATRVPERKKINK